jgi:beta-fructofuranosidase
MNLLTVDDATREKFLHDHQRPVFHFLPPMNWMNDPNGLIQWQGTYHLFYQHYPLAAKWGPMHWGHAVSQDLVHWEHKPIAMEPTPGGPDAEGVWSGCAVNNNGVPTMIYSGNSAVGQRACLAFSHDDLQTLEKYPAKPVIPDWPAGYDVYQYRDHCVWHDGQQWNQLIGSGIQEKGGTIFLYQSPDLLHWQLVGPILQGDMDMSNPMWSGRMWECPDLIPLGDKHILVISAYSPLPGELEGYTGYFLGKFADGKFHPESYHKMDLGEREFYAPQSFVNEAGERIQFGWLGEARREDACLEAGWAGVMSLPRLLSLRPDRRLGMAPHPAMDGLRVAGSSCGALQVTSGQQDLDLNGKALELHAVIGASSTAKRCGLKVFAAPDGSEETAIVFEPEKRTLKVERLHSSLDGRCAFTSRGGEVALDSGEDLDLRIYLDHSIVEIYINGRQALSCRAYPTQAEASGVFAFAEDGSCEIRSLDAWEMHSIW